jgi:plastocyanin
MKIKFLNLSFAAVLAIAIVGCGGSKSESTSQPAPAAPTSAKTVDPSTAGSITGTVSLDGVAPTARPINMSAEPYCAKAHSTPIVPPEVVTGDKGSLANVVIFVKSGLGPDYTFDAPKDSVTLDQKGCMYDPHVIALMTGQTIAVKNDDQTTHNIHPTPQSNREWNESQPPNAAPIQKTFAREEIMLPVKCNQHPWMRMYINVVKSPFYAVSGPDGKYEIKGLPPGTYTLAFVQEKLGEQTQQVTLAAKDSKTVDQSFKQQ